MNVFVEIIRSKWLEKKYKQKEMKGGGVKKIVTFLKVTITIQNS